MLCQSDKWHTEGSNAPTPAPILNKSTTRHLMTYTFTDTVQIDEGCEIPTNIDDVLAQVDEILFDRYQIGGCDYTQSGENEWATDEAIGGILNSKTAEQIAELIADQWEPSDQEMMASFGTKWHDGL